VEATPAGDTLARYTLAGDTLAEATPVGDTPAEPALTLTADLLKAAYAAIELPPPPTTPDTAAPAAPESDGALKIYSTMVVSLVQMAWRALATEPRELPGDDRAVVLFVLRGFITLFLFLGEH
jgi:hypothetical protein